MKLWDWLKNETAWLGYRKGDRYGCLGMLLATLAFFILRLDLLPAQREEIVAGLLLLLAALGQWVIRKMGAQIQRNGDREPGDDHGDAP